MRRTLHVAALVGLMALPALVSAQAAKRVSIGLSGGLSLPMQKLGDNANSGFNITGHYFYRSASRTSMLFRGDVAFDSWGGKETAAGAGVDASYSSLGFMGNLVLSAGGVRSTARPYVLAGVGIIRSQATISGATTGLKSSDTKFGVQGGAGFEFSLSGLSSFVEAKYVIPQKPKSWAYVPITFGVRF